MADLPDDDPLKEWRKEHAALGKIFELIEPLTMHERLRLLEVVTTLHGHDDLAARIRTMRARLPPEEPHPPR